MQTYIAFLRGINVGGNRIIKSADLKACFEDLKFTDVRVVLASGNVIFSSTESDEAALKDKIEKTLAKIFDYPAKLQLVALPLLKTIIADYPFDLNIKANHHYILFATSDAITEILKAAAEAGEKDGIAKGKGVIYWTIFKGKTLDSPFSKILSKAKFKDVSTMRNINTLKKIVG